MLLCHEYIIFNIQKPKIEIWAIYKTIIEYMNDDTIEMY